PSLSDQRQDLGGRIELLAETTGQPVARGAAEVGVALLEAVLVERFAVHRVDQGATRSLGRQAIRVSRAKIYHVDARFDQASLDRRDACQRITRQCVGARVGADHDSAPTTELLIATTPGISISMRS